VERKPSKIEIISFWTFFILSFLGISGFGYILYQGNSKLEKKEQKLRDDYFTLTRLETFQNLKNEVLKFDSIGIAESFKIHNLIRDLAIQDDNFSIQHIMVKENDTYKSISRTAYSEYPEGFKIKKNISNRRIYHYQELEKGADPVKRIADSSNYKDGLFIVFLGMSKDRSYFLEMTMKI